MAGSAAVAVEDRTPVRDTGINGITPLAILTAIWATAQIGYHLAGVRFDASTRESYWHFLDAAVLRHDLLGSLWYLHTQPPLFNFFLWLSESVSPFGLYTTAHATYLALGLALTLGSCLLARELGLGWGGAVTLGAVVGCNPVTVLYQNYLYTTMPETTLVVLVVLALARFERTNARRDLALFFLGCATLVYLRSVFHPFWFLAVVALVGWWASRRIGPKRVAAVAAVPVVLVAGLSLKNELVFGDPGTSSWLGMSLARLTTYPLNGSPELQELRRRGEVDDVAFATPFFPFSTYESLGVGEAAPHGLEATDAQTRRSGWPNLNYWGYLEASRRSLHDDLAFIAEYPGAYIARVRDAWRAYLASPSSLLFVQQNRAAVTGIDEAWRLLAYGERPSSFGLPAQEPDNSSVGIVTVVVMGTLAAAALAATIGRPRRLRSLVRRASIVFGIATCFGFALVVNATELGENMRFRYEVEPLQMVLAVALVVGAVARYRPSVAPGPVHGAAANEATVPVEVALRP